MNELLAFRFREYLNKLTIPHTSTKTSMPSYKVDIIAVNISNRVKHML